MWSLPSYRSLALYFCVAAVAVLNIWWHEETRLDNAALPEGNFGRRGLLQAGCLLVDGYTFYPGEDFKYSDITCGVRGGLTVQGLAALCSSTPSCRSFNFFGTSDEWYCLKSRRGPLTDESTTYMFKPCQGIYVADLPLDDYTTCGTLASVHSTVPGISWGTLRSANQWTTLECDVLLCSVWNQLYGVVPNKTWGTLPTGIQYQQSWNWVRRGYNASCDNLIREAHVKSWLHHEDLRTQTCSQLLNQYQILPGSNATTNATTTPSADTSAMQQWAEYNCDVRICNYWVAKYGLVQRNASWDLSSLPDRYQPSWQWLRPGGGSCDEYAWPQLAAKIGAGCQSVPFGFTFVPGLDMAGFNLGTWKKFGNLSWSNVSQICLNNSACQSFSVRVGGTVPGQGPECRLKSSFAAKPYIDKSGTDMQGDCQGLFNRTLTPPVASPSPQAPPPVAKSPPPSVAGSQPPAKTNTSTPPTGNNSPNSTPNNTSSAPGTDPIPSLSPTPADSSSEPSSSSSSSSNSKSTTAAIVGGVVGGVVFLLLLLLLIAWWRVGRKRKARGLGKAMSTDLDYGLIKRPQEGPDKAASLSGTLGSEGAVVVTVGAGNMAERDRLTGTTTASDRTVTGVSGGTASIRPSTPELVAQRSGREAAATAPRAGGGGINLLAAASSAREVDPVWEAAVQRSVLSKIPWQAITIGRELGKGGFGLVNKAIWQGNPVAVKTLSVDKLQHDAHDKLRQEALIMCGLRHPCIAPVYGLVDDGSHLALVMRFYKRGTLADAIISPLYQQRSLDNRLSMALRVASGMVCLHGREPAPMLHGDLKTSNLLIEDDNMGVVIADFGLACCLRPGQSGQVVPGAALTVSISPPEVLQNPEAPRTSAGDVYAFAICLLECAGGVRAFKGMSRAQVMKAVCEEKRPAIPENVPREVGELITACWAQDPAVRPTFEQVVERLEAVVRAHGAAGADDLTSTTTMTQTG